MSTASSSPPRTGARAAGRRIDRWFRELGLPTFVPLRRWFIDLPRRVAPLITAATILAALSDDQFDRAIDEAVRLVPEVDDGQWIVVTIVLAVLAILALLAWAGYRLVRAAMRRLSPAVGNAVGVALILVCLALLVIGGYLAKPGATVGPAFSAIATVLVCMLITGMGGGALLSWGTRLAVRNASAVGHMASIALPVILMLVVFAFFSAEVWQMSSALHWGSIALVGLVVGALALVVVLRVCASEIDDMGRVLSADERGHLLAGTPVEGRPGAERAPTRPLRLVQRINLLLVMAVAQLMQALLFAALLWSLLMIIGGIAVPVGVVELWVGPGTPAHPLRVEPLVVGGATLPITVNLVKSAAVLSIISTLPFVFSAVSEARYRERFFDPIMADIRRAIVVRDALLATAGGAAPAAATRDRGGIEPQERSVTDLQLPTGVRSAAPADADEMARILSAAFLPDPVWGPLFPDPARREAQTRAYWRFMVDEALRHPDSLVLEGEAGGLRAVSVWLPPGADEVAEDAHDAYETLVLDLLGPEAAPAMFRSGEQFGAARPTDPHAYLTLLAVAPDARGGGHGMALLRAGLDRYDAAGTPTYLESSNPANDARYERLGYAPYAVVRLDDGGQAQTYWRDPA